MNSLVHTCSPKNDHVSKVDDTKKICSLLPPLSPTLHEEYSEHVRHCPLDAALTRQVILDLALVKEWDSIHLHTDENIATNSKALIIGSHLPVENDLKGNIEYHNKNSKGEVVVPLFSHSSISVKSLHETIVQVGGDNTCQPNNHQSEGVTFGIVDSDSTIVYYSATLKHSLT